LLTHIATTAKRFIVRADEKLTYSGIREIEEACALLENQLHSFYRRMFSTCKTKGFNRPKATSTLAGFSENRSSKALISGIAVSALVLASSLNRTAGTFS
jgi:hypothetical protein